ncbi:hypothetical protein FQR65_LT02748 [Abscondita terminalis]|nr:hypothetical protein FQR65_LT02748 [Abscondita terminalis]
MIEIYEASIDSNRTMFDIMKSLATPCEELLVECIWKTKTYKCSKLFHLRATYLGFCCTFNYLLPFTKDKVDLRLGVAGPQNGLIVEAKSDINDYFYPSLPTTGLSVQIFTPTDYPDAHTGNHQLKFVPLNSETSFILEPQTFYSVAEVRKHPIKMRNCIFSDEVRTAFGNYSYSNCLMDCRLRSMLTLCQCVHFLMPFAKINDCTLSDLPCLSKYQDKWINLYPFNLQSDELDKEKDYSLYCSGCLPDCDIIKYKLDFDTIPFNTNYAKNIKNSNVIKVYFKKSYGKLYKQDVVCYWYEAISKPAKSQKLNIEYEVILNYLKNLGKLYDYDITNAASFVKIQGIIDTYETSIGSSRSVYEIMKSLVTPCEELLIKCIWKTKTYNCSKLFQLRSTYVGFCCTFNYLRSYTSEVEERLNAEGEDNGLIITARSDLDDYCFPSLPSIGLNVQIFTPTDYPDATSGSLLFQLLPINTEALFGLEPQTFYSVSEVKKYPIALRSCIFSDEVRTAFGNYSYSNCLVDCRVRSMLALCQCVPFLLPLNRDVSCTLSDLQCLSKYQDKWKNLYPYDLESDELDKEKENGLVCDECYADCESVRYKLSFNSIPFNTK